MTQDPLAQLRELLSKKPSEKRFKQILEFFQEHHWENTESQERAIHYADSHLDSWSDTLRKSGAYWLWRECPEGEPEKHFCLIRHLDLGSNSEGVYRFGPEGAKKLAQSPHVAKITKLYFWGNGLQDEGMIALANSPYLTQLQHLMVFGNQVGNRGALALANSTKLTQLKKLTLSYNKIGDEGAIALANSPHLKHLRELHLNDNELGQEGAFVIAFSGQLTKATRHYWLKKLPFSTLTKQAEKMGIKESNKIDSEKLIQRLLRKTKHQP